MIQRNKPLIPPYAMELQYRRELQSLISAMVKDFRTLVTIYKNKREQIALDDATWLSSDIQDRLKRLGTKWQERFNKYAETATPERVEKLLKQSDLQLKESLRNYLAAEQLTLIGTTIPVKLRQVMKVNIAENISLIKSIPEQYLKSIQTILTNVVNGNAAWKDFQKEIAHRGEMTMKRAKLIASDQTNKVFNALTLRRFEQCGVTKVQWFHTYAKEPRAYHIRKWDGKSGADGHPNGLNRFVFELNNPPIIDEKTGQRGFPGELINCHCNMVPVTEFSSI